MESNAKSYSLFCDRIAGRLRSGSFPGDAAAIAVAPDRAAAIQRIPGFLRAAAGGAEFVFDEPVGQLLSEGVAGGDAGRGNIRRAALAESSAGAADAGGGSGHGMVVRGGAEYFAVGVGTSGSGSACVVGVSPGVAPFYEGRAGGFDMSM